MIVSVDWLQQYVAADMPIEDLTNRLTMSGLNLEDVATADGDTAIDLEVTSNRPDCLGHIGVAREIAVLFDRELNQPPARPVSIGLETSGVTSVQIECEDLCPQYTARVIRNVKIGPSPDWLRRRLEVAHWDFANNTTKYNSINNVVDITNYVMLECGQPLHAFDFGKLSEKRIVVRRARSGEKITAIDQREYALDEEMCVIADASRAVAIGGVMGGFDSEISDGTTDVLIEAATFAPLSIRRTARKLKLFSPSSYRFERGVDRVMLDWASRRCCELILQCAGGELYDGVALAGTAPPVEREPIRLRFSEVNRIVGIDVKPSESTAILSSLGLENHGEASAEEGLFTPPSWRRDLTREVDLVEEVARIHGYDNIPENAILPVVATSQSRADRVANRIRETLTSLGFYDCLTLSFVSAAQAAQFNPVGVESFVSVEHSTRQLENILRASIVPSLLTCRRDNERQGNHNAELFEIARVYLAADTTRPENDVEPITVSGVSGRSFSELKGVLETLASRVDRSCVVSCRPTNLAAFNTGRGAEILINGQPWGWIGELHADVVKAVGLRDEASAFEVRVAPLVALADLEPHYSVLPTFPAVSRDLNFVIDEDVSWEDLVQCVRDNAGEHLDSVSFGGQYRGKQIKAGKKSYVVTSQYRAVDRTLTSEEVEAAQQRVIEACADSLNAQLRA